MDSDCSGIEHWIGKIHHGDSLDILGKLPPESVGVFITSPPYNLKNSTGNGMKNGSHGKWANAALLQGYEEYSDDLPYDVYVDWQRNNLHAMMQALRPDGAIFYNHKWRVQNGLLQDRSEILTGFPVRQVIIWKRKGGINFNPGYFLPTYEVIYLIAKPEFKLSKGANALGDVWEIPQERDNEHPAPFPIELAKRCVLSSPAGVVCDPFMGSGTTALAAETLQRPWIGVEKAKKYIDLADKRLRDLRNIQGFFPVMYADIKSQIATICAEDTHTMLCTDQYDTGAPGLHLESLLGVEVNNRDTADLAQSGVEVKFTSNTTPITMLHLDPTERPKRAKKDQPRVVGAVEQLIRDFGYINDDGLLAFRHMIRGGTPTTGDRVSGFFAQVEGDRINIRHVSRDQPVASWSADVVTNAITQKMRRLLAVGGERDGDKVSYNKATLFLEPRSSHILEMIANGMILIDFDARLKHDGSVRNHGVKFRIYAADLGKLYRENEVICDHT